MRVDLPAGGSTAIGSVPHTDPRQAAAFSLRHSPALPAAPQLSASSPAEGMVAQAAAGIEGVTVGPDGSLAIDAARLHRDGAIDVPLDPAAWTGLLAFLDLVARRRRPIKLQLTGPVTLGLALVHAGAPASTSFAVAADAVRARVGALIALAAEKAPDAPLVVFLDEPGLTAAGHPGFPLDRELIIDLLSGALAAIEPAVTGVHCCGDTDWRISIDAGAQVLSLPLDPELVRDAGVVAAFLENGGWIAWGAVPTTGPVGTDADPLWRRLTSVWCDLTRAGCDPLLLRKQSLITPACGLANHGLSQADLVMDLVSVLAQRVQEQALATRLSVGA